MAATTSIPGRSMPASASAPWAASAMSSWSGSLRRPTRVIPAPATYTLRGIPPPSLPGRTGKVNEIEAAENAAPQSLSSARRAAADGGRRGGHAELPDEAQQIGPLQSKRAGRVRAVATGLMQRGLDEPALEVRHGPVIADGPREGRDVWSRDSIHGQRGVRRACHARASQNWRRSTRTTPATCPARWAACTETKGPRWRRPDRMRREARSGLGGRLDPRIVLEELLVELDEALPLIGRLVFREDRLDRAHGLARAAVDALVGVDEELVLAFVDAIDRAYLDAGLVLDADARLGDHIRHWGLPISLVGLVRPRLCNSMTPDCQVFRVLKTRRALTGREAAGRGRRAASRRRD